MTNDLLLDIEKFIELEKIGEHRFGILAANNGRLVERLRSGGRVWPETAEQVKGFMASRRPDIFAPSKEETR
ncbi:hypothetical protein KYK29_10255 [Shinella daejeonensis]|uniref:hypothetical protein n=1 Tax=Shinella daejeonensis TaxID=659017 RepID=UPI0020C81038|nr:hypothetical protein [Shinella daejeonensis]MCP8895317.1 hypothetical protein [Shinella daejeonensis]